MSDHETTPKKLMSQSTSNEDGDVTDVDTINTRPNIKNINGQSVMVGELPSDFLRLDLNSSLSGSESDTRRQIELDEEMAASLQAMYNQQAHWNYQAHLSVTLVEALLNRNYGMMNMSLYTRMRFGTTIFETNTCNRCGKTPKWNQTFTSFVPKGIKTIGIEIYDDCLFTQDTLIAWGTYDIPDSLWNFNAEPEHNIDIKLPLSGKLGEGLEGHIFFVIKTKPVTKELLRTCIATPMYVPTQPLGVPSMFQNPILVHQSNVPASTLLPPMNQVAESQPQSPPPISEEHVNTLREMFPNIEIDLIKSILINANGDLEQAITNLLELNSTN